MTLMFEISCLSLLAVGGLMLQATFDLWSFHKGFVQGGEVLSIDTHVLKEQPNFFTTKQNDGAICCI